MRYLHLHTYITFTFIYIYNVVLNRTVVDSDWRFDNLRCGSPAFSRSRLVVSRPLMVMNSGH